jgi:hypothetical protein
MPNVTSVVPASPYLTVAELKRSPIYTQLQKLVPGGSQADNDAELGRIIMRVSAMINGETRQNLAASVDTEADWATVSDRGDLRIHTRGNPIVSVVSVSVGADPYSLTAVSDLSRVDVDPWQITIPARALPGFGGRSRRRVWAEWTYVTGYPVTTLSAPVSAGGTSMTVVDATGVVAGQTTLTVEDGKWLETVTPTAVAGNVLTVAPLEFAHQDGVGVSALPGDIQEAALILISRLHNTWSLSMGAVTHDGTGARKNPNAPGIGARFLCDPGVILEPYKRVW